MMKTIKLLALFVLIALLATGCASSLLNGEEDDTCETTKISDSAAPASATVPSYNDEAVTDAFVTEAAVEAPVLKNINFDFDQHVLTEAARIILDENARYLQVHSDANVVIAGYCDERGSDEYNLALGERRAVAAQNYLISMGISPQRISIISYGEENPIDPASNEDAWALNRRDEFTPQF
ncbi:MAG: hypothetical protein B6I36_03615 [Desulfobacteraceae bacterium 4572_35.1]|nr:MAG: hypothetical protein B6I36_03615 [Desulfobacteraceae bacterium 4572_35.1]